MTGIAATESDASISGWQFWIDRGGTFTDVIARSPDGQLTADKLLSDNPGQYPDAAVAGVRRALGLADDAPIPPDTIDTVRMGTTVATNALLERNGERVALVTNAGLGDLPAIGTQARPRLFDLNIRRPEILHERVIEVDARVDANGDIVTPLDETAARLALDRAYAAGIRSLAIALIHGYRYCAQEQRLAELAQEVGFNHVSVSSETSALMKLVPRSETTVADAYLSPQLGRYIDSVAEALGTGRGGARQLLFMQSNGGLTDAARFRGRDAVLSGPCGGVVGMARTGEAAGFSRLIGFDMGGTSTDVCHYRGELERVDEAEIGGIRLQTPMLALHTVAAGGGSLLTFDGDRLRVGPASAGADPGPTCYRRGGPLTVTDANVLLGRIQPAFFPAVLGDNGGQRLDAEAVTRAFEQLAAEINAASPDATPQSAEAIAEGFIAIAVDNMARAIKRISVERGFDLADYALNCFGGAGGQHACQVADALAIDRVFLHPLAGVLSAFGMGVADRRALRPHQVEARLNAATLTDVTITADQLAAETRAALTDQGLAPETVTIAIRAALRQPGAHQALDVDWAEAETMRDAFAESHRQRFGFVGATDDLVLESITVEAIGQAPIAAEPAAPAAPVGPPCQPCQPCQPTEHVTMRAAGESVAAPVYERARLTTGQSIDGPALIVESTATTVVDADWNAQVDDRGRLILARRTSRPSTQTLDRERDPVMLEIFNNRFRSIAEQMGATLAKTAYSVNIKERFDFSCALFDADGGLVANAPHVPVHLGSMSAVVRALIAAQDRDIQPGDVFAANLPFAGGTHLPDVTVMTPVFDETASRIIFYVASRGHHADIGGRTPGSSPADSVHIDEEGVQIDNFRLVAEGVFREAELRDLLASGPYPCRNINQNVADLSAQIAANETGAAELRKLVAGHGEDVVVAYTGHVKQNAEDAVRRAVDALGDCQYRYELDNGSHIDVAIRLDRDTRAATIDFAGTSDQVQGNYNAPLPICHAAVLYVFRTLIDDDIPLNEGCLRPLAIHAPEGSIINCVYPAAVIAGNTEISQSICEALYGALGILAGSQGTVNNLAYGNDGFQNYETLCGGTGAGPDFNGTSAVHSHMTNTRLTDPEVLEFRYPLRVDEFKIRRDSGGSGRQRGGDGAIRRLRFLSAATLTTLSSHRRRAPFGVDSGQPGATGRNAVERASGRIEELAGNAQTEMQPGDVLIMETPGGGGYGPSSATTNNTPDRD